MTTHSGDNPTVTYKSSKWHSAIHATVAVSRFRSSLSQSARQQGPGGPKHLQSEFQMQNGPGSEHHDTSSQSSHNEEANQAAQLDRELEVSPEVELLKLISEDVMKRMDTCAVILVLLAGITFVAILQPPGSFDEAGMLQESFLVSLFMLLASLSFFIACTGLWLVIMGYGELFRPSLYPKLDKHVRHNSEPRYLPVENEGNHVSIDSLESDALDHLCHLCLRNVYRAVRIRIYVAVSLALCVAAYICGALAVVVTNDRQRYMLVGAMAVACVILVYETYCHMRHTTI